MDRHVRPPRTGRWPLTRLNGRAVVVAAVVVGLLLGGATTPARAAAGKATPGRAAASPAAATSTATSTRSAAPTVDGLDPAPPAAPETLSLPATPIVAATSGVWTVPGGGSVSSRGDYSYSIPLAVPDGRAGMQPHLSLGYSSGAGNGPLGVGWQVAGLSQIERCRQTLAEDGQIRGIRFQKSNDRFCLDGQKLVLVGSVGTSASYGDIDAEYRTETDTYDQIVSGGSGSTIADGPDYFIALTKDGHILRFDAFTAQQKTARVTDSAGWPTTVVAASTRTVAWLLTSEKDRSGNEVRYRYLQPVAGDATFLPYKIDYTYGPGRAAYRTVEFVYGSRPDTGVSYVAGVRSQVVWRLAAIRMYAPNPAAKQMVWQYKLGYQTSASKRSLLASVQRCGVLGGCTRAKKFTYGTAAGPTFTDRYVASGNELNIFDDWKPGVQVADLNGDGASDLYYERGGPDTVNHIRLGARTETGATPLAAHYTDTGVFTGLRHMAELRAVDYDGDGTEEIAVPLALGGLPPTYTIRFYHWDDTTHAFVFTGKGAPGSARFVDFADMTGDGRPDALPAVDTGSGEYRYSVAVNTGSGFQPATVAAGAPAFAYGCPVKATDVDGDGRAELWGNSRTPVVRPPITYDDDGKEMWEGKEDGAPRPKPTGGNCRNGGDNAWIALGDDGAQTVEYAFGTLPNGTRGYRYVPWLPQSYTDISGDFNGDGLADGILAPIKGGTATLMFNTGIGVTTAGTIQIPAGGDVQTPTGTVHTRPDVRVADIDGDGIDDLFVLTGAGIAVKLSNGDGTFRDGPAVTGGAGVNVPERGRVMTQVGDFNADGRPDLLRWVGEDIRILEQTTGPTADRLTQVTDEGTAWPAETVDYARAWSEHPEKFTQYLCSYPLACLRQGRTVVRALTSFEHNADPATASAATGHKVCYSYEDPVVDLRGRGFLGFGIVRTWDPARPVETISQYDHRGSIGYGYHPQVAVPFKVTTATPIVSATRTGTTSETARISRTYNTYTTVTTHDMPGPDTYAVRPTYSYTKQWEQTVTVVWGSGLAAGGPDQHVSAITEPATDKLLRMTSRDASFDAYGNITRKSVFTTGGVAEEVTTSYDNRTVNAEGDGTDWLIGLPVHQSTKRSEADNDPPAVTRSVDYHHDDLGRLDKVEIEKASTDPDVRQTTTYGYDALGVRRVATETAGDPTAPALPPRETHTEYDPVFPGQPDEEVYPSQTWQQHSPATLRSSTWTAVQPAFGVPVARMDANGVQATTTFDEFGNPVAARGDGGAPVDYGYAARTDAAGGTNGVVTTVAGAGVTTTTATDALGRTLRATATGFDAATTTMSRTRYDMLGRVRTSTGATPVGTTTNDYDSLDRPLKTTLPDGKTTTSVHTFATTTTTDAGGQQNTLTRDVDGRTLSSADLLVNPDGTTRAVTTSYQYGPFDLTAKVIDDAGNTTTMAYDVRGRRTSLTEPDRGTTTTGYFGTGEIRTVHDAVGVTATFGYDDMGRQTGRADDDGTTTRTTTYTFDTAAHGIGKPAAANSPDDVVTGYRYDGDGHTAGIDTTGAGTTYSIDHGYDTSGRQTTITYPQTGTGRLVLHNVYNGNGYIQALTYQRPGEDTTRDLYAITARQPNLALDTATMSTGAITLKNIYTPATGRLLNRTVTANGVELQDLTYGYHDNGLVKSRLDASSVYGWFARGENFGYDTLGRLTSWTVNEPAINNRTDYTYETTGNLTGVDRTFQTAGAPEDEDRGYGAADGAQPHTLTSITTTSCAGVLCSRLEQTPHYDAKGRQTSGNGRAVTYTPFDLPRSITRGTKTTTYTYDAFGQRFSETTGTDVTVTVAGLYERRTEAGATRHVHHINGPDGPIGQIVTDGAGGADVQYQLTDALGSVTATVDTAGTRTGSFWYDPFGQRINHNASLFTGTTGDTDTGFTGHQHDDDLGLINMTGRLYDPAQKRFLTPDPLVGDPTDGQQYNPYSYVRNSPVNLTDPTGYRACDDGMLLTRHNYDGSECGNQRGRALFAQDVRADSFFTSVTGFSGGDCAPGVSCDTVQAVQARDAQLLANYKLQEQRAAMSQRAAEVNQAGKPWGWNTQRPKLTDGQLLGRPDANNSVHTGRPDGAIVYEGHGVWRAVDGYIVVPEGTTITFYSPHGTNIFDVAGPLIAKDLPIGYINVGGKLLLYQPQTFYPGDVIPNYWLLPNGPMVHGDTEYFVSQPLRLDILLQPNMGNVHWAACRQVIPDNYAPWRGIADIYPR